MKQNFCLVCCTHAECITSYSTCTKNKHHLLANTLLYISRCLANSYAREALIVPALLTNPLSGSQPCVRALQVWGFDIMLDSSLKAWLIEVNTCPALNSDSPLDKHLKVSMVSDLMHLVSRKATLGGSKKRILQFCMETVWILHPDCVQIHLVISGAHQPGAF